MITIQQIAYGGWPTCYRIANGTIEAVVTGDVGPRVIRFGFVGGQNFFKEFTEQMGRSGEAEWQARGGHRLWMAPEHRVKTYAPDNSPVEVEVTSGALSATAPVEPLTGLEKRIMVGIADAGASMKVIHHIRNAGTQAVELAPWALTMFAPGGIVIHGFPPRRSYEEALDVCSPLVMWAYTDFTDPRWTLLRKYLVLRQDANNHSPQKAGAFNSRTWGAYLLNGELFVKRSAAPGRPADYTDNGCSFETFTNADFLELETLGPVVLLAPGDTVSHTEYWTAHRNVNVAEWTDAELDRVIAPLAE